MPGPSVPGVTPPTPNPVVTTKTPPVPNPANPASGGLFHQPPFDVRITTIHNPANTSTDSGELLTGYMIWDLPNSTATSGNSLAAVEFLYNPSTVATTNSLQPAGSAAGDAALSSLYTAYSQQVLMSVPMSSSVSFSLLYDRSFEVWGAPQQNTGVSEINNPAASGVMVDVLAFKQFTGMLSNSAGQGNSNGDQQNIPVQSNMFVIPAWICFGGPVGGTGLQYFGFITEWDVQFTHWSQFMIPIRCVINVSFSLMPTTAAAGSAGAASSTGSVPGNPSAAPWFTLNGINQALPLADGGLPSVTSVPGGKGGTLWQSRLAAGTSIHLS